jgi:signal transduction histidine kinase
MYRCQGDPFIIATAPVIYGSNYVGTITIGQKLNSPKFTQLEVHSDIHLAFWKNADREALASVGQMPLPALTYLLNSGELQQLNQGQMVYKQIKIGHGECQAAFFTYTELVPRQQEVFAVYRSLDFLKQANQVMLFHLAVLIALVVIVGGVFAWWISLRVTDPLARLSRVAHHLAALDFSERVEVATQDEIGDLANSIGYLSSALQENIAKKDHYAGELASLNVNLERQVASRTEDLVHANDRLKREMEEKEDFLRAISHDLGAPLRNIAGLARLLERRNRGTLGKEGLEMIERISNNVKNELSMIEMLLELSRIKTRRSKFSQVVLPEIVGQIRDDLSFSIAEKLLNLNVQAGLPTIWAEENRIRQVFQNLIDNAIKYIGNQSAPEISVGWSEHPSAWMFWVSDNGIGIPADQRHKIFGVFRRVRSRETGSVEGKGVGLASVKTIVEMYGGEIWVESELGQGSTFYFTLDRALVNVENRQEQVSEDSEEPLIVTSYAHTIN